MSTYSAPDDEMAVKRAAATETQNEARNSRKGAKLMLGSVSSVNAPRNLQNDR